LQGRPNTIVNAITNDADRIRDVLPLAAQHGAGVIAILSHGPNPARTLDERMSAAEALHRAIQEAGIPDERQYFDPQVLPLGFDPIQPKAVLETIREIKRRWPFAKTIAGLSNISFNLPQRSLLNRTFLAMLLASGLDGVILNPCDKALSKALLAARALLGKDDFLTDYLAGADS
jgi:5-methyltetrahydrofolate--homocysteine methyltransferase